MQAAVLRSLHAPLSVERVQLDEPGEREVLVQIAASGVCHSDVGRIDGVIPSPLPMVMGHEGAGVVRAVGPGVRGVEVGDHVVLNLSPYCGSCARCGGGEFSACERIFESRAAGTLMDGTSRMRIGDETIHHQSAVSSFAEYTVVPESGAVPIRRDVPLDRAALVGCGVTSGVVAVFNDAKVRPGDSVAVFGTGGVGLNVVQAAAISGALRVIAVDVLPSRLALAEEFGATHLIEASREDPVRAVRAIVGGGVDHAFEVVGEVEVVQQALAATRPLGRCWVLGAVPNVVLPLRTSRLMRGYQRIRFSGIRAARPRADIPRILNLYMAGKLKLDELVSHRFPLEGINEAIRLLRSGEGTRSLVLPNGAPTRTPG